MERRAVNPWSWQDQRGFTQAWRIDGGSSITLISGQAPVSADGDLIEGDFEAQARRTFENLLEVLDRAGASFTDVMKVTAYFTDIADLAVYGRLKAEYMPGHAPASTAVEVRALAMPGMAFELEAIAVT